MSLLCARASRLAALVGTSAATAVLGVAYLLAERISVTSGAPGAYQVPLLGVSLVASLILMALVASLGPPLRAEEEDPLALATRRREDD
jgi:hypothetical protein